MAKLLASDVLGVREARLKVQPIAGWTWYCGYHDSYGIVDDEDEALFMAGAHMHYHQIDGDVCELHFKEWEGKKDVA